MLPSASYLVYYYLEKGTPNKVRQQTVKVSLFSLTQLSESVSTPWLKDMVLVKA